jgi:adenosylcobinamide amidohydrolase
VWCGDRGVEVLATVGLGWPCWAADDDGAPNPYETSVPGTVNVIVWVPARLGDAALVNTVATVAEAKAQALGDAGVPGTGTASDAVVVCCPSAGAPDPYGGPRSTWGSRLARAVHRAVLAGAPEDERVARHGGVRRAPRPPRPPSGPPPR